MLKFYKIIASLTYPYVYFFMKLRKRRGKEDLERFGERKGIPGIERPQGDIIWMHGSSVGETLSMLPLIERILEEQPQTHVMVTSGSVTSAALMKKRLPKRAFHQYIPIDLPFYTKRFVQYWKPKAILWFESDFWPCMLSDINETGIPLILINGRISDKSFHGWQRAPNFIKTILGMFTLALGQSPNDAERLSALGAPNVACEGNIKFAAHPLPYDGQELELMRQQMAGRKNFLVSSTHYDEEERFIPIYKNLLKAAPDILMLIASRHPSRGESIQQAMIKAGFKTARRTKHDPVKADTQVYIADTMGEMGLFYKLSNIVFIGGSLINHGGQNFFEPMHFNDAVIVGPNMHNFRLPMKLAQEQDAVIQVHDEKELEKTLHRLLTDESYLSSQMENSRKFSKNLNQVLDKIYDKIKELI